MLGSAGGGGFGGGGSAAGSAAADQIGFEARVKDLGQDIDSIFNPQSSTLNPQSDVRRMPTEVLLAGLAFSVAFPVVLAGLLTWSGKYTLEGADAATKKID